MGKREDNVEEIVNKVCKDCFCNGFFDKGRKILYKLYLKDYDKLDNMNTRYKLLYRLIYAEYTEGNKDAVCKYVLQLKHDMDNTLNYKENYKGDYCNMLSCYCDLENIILTKKERLECYKFSYDYYKKLYELHGSMDIYIRMVNIKFNIEKIQQNFSRVLKIIEGVHNIKDIKAQTTLTQMLHDIKEIDEHLYNKAIQVIQSTTKQCV